MVSIDVSNSENQFDWLEGSRYGSNCQKIHSTDVAEFKKPVQAIKLFERNNLEIQEFRLQFQRFLPKETSSSESAATKRKRGYESERYIREHLPI